MFFTHDARRITFPFHPKQIHKLELVKSHTVDELLLLALHYFTVETSVLVYLNA